MRTSIYTHVLRVSVLLLGLVATTSACGSSVDAVISVVVNGGSTPSPTCNDSCTYASDGVCDVIDGVCAPGTDCSDCGDEALCNNECPYADDGICDEDSLLCGAGTDCSDCGPPADPSDYSCSLYAPNYCLGNDLVVCEPSAFGFNDLVVYPCNGICDPFAGECMPDLVCEQIISRSGAHIGYTLQGGGCNTLNGCWEAGGGCNSHGCWLEGESVCTSSSTHCSPRRQYDLCDPNVSPLMFESCIGVRNSFGSHIGYTRVGGGCDPYDGCWERNGGCNSYGCWLSGEPECTSNSLHCSPRRIFQLCDPDAPPLDFDACIEITSPTGLHLGWTRSGGGCDDLNGCWERDGGCNSHGCWQSGEIPCTSRNNAHCTYRRNFQLCSPFEN